MKEWTMNKSTRQLQISAATRERVKERDESCIFCRRGLFRPPFSHLSETQIPEIMHVVNKSQGGLGVEKNLVLGCHYHHNMMDNGYQGNGKEMREICVDYLTDYYGSWSEEEVTRAKWSPLSAG